MSTFIKGMAAGIAVGAAATIMIDPLSKSQKNKLKRKTKGFFKNIGTAIDSALCI
ncbi:MAG: hypothetical protein J1F64_01205 [Oscillospiraceae bacterium]|nr:hypothetical protein [Oscillospiraceae bacterium]